MLRGRPFTPCLRVAFLVLRVAAAAHGTIPTNEGAATDTTYDFGAVKQGETIAHSFYVENTLAIPLKIARIDLSAPGMTTRVKPTIPPGTAGEVELAWNTTKVSSEVSGKATVHFVGDLHPDVVFALKGRVTPEIEAIPLAGFYISLFRDESVESSITLINHRDLPLAINELRAPSPLFRAALETPTPGQVYKLTLKVPSGLKPGRYAEEIELQTGNPENPVIRIPVNIIVKNFIYASETVVDFGDIDRAQLRSHPELTQNCERAIMVRKRSGQFAITSIVSDVPGLRVVRSPESISQSFELQLACRPELLPEGRLAATIDVLTTDPEVPELRIAIRGYVR